MGFTHPLSGTRCTRCQVSVLALRSGSTEMRLRYELPAHLLPLFFGLVAFAVFYPGCKEFET